ncbi:MAG: sugar ABC transporter substrate-binding protein [Treponema sp.]|jgi:ribose transport system substrate-binding protein|nr:sugar ABC transporter substrate-binding protein [Treponema sp.]
MNRSLTITLALVLVGGGLLFAGGQRSGTSTQQYEIAFSLKTITNDDFQRAIAESIEKAVTGMGHKFSLVMAGEQTAVATQVNQLEDLIAKKVSGIILSPMDSRAVIPALRKAKEAGIPVVLVDNTIEPGNEDLYVTYIGTDNFNAGRVGGQTLAKTLNNTGNVLIIRGANGSSAGDDRVNGFKEGIKDSGLRIVGEQPGDWTNSVAMQVTENMLQANPQVDGLFTASDVMLDGILTALQNANRSNVKIMAVDGSRAAVELIEAGEVYGTMAQFPGRMGPRAVETIIGVLDKTTPASSVPKYIDSGTACYTRENLNDAKAEMF